MDDDPDLVRSAKLGDVAAYECLVRRYQDVAWRTAYLITGSEVEAEDAAQEAMVKAYTALPGFRDDARFKPWLLAIVANEARNRRRAAGRRARLSLKVAVDPAAADPGPSPEAAAELGEQRQRLVAAMAGLRDRDRDVVALRYLLGLSEAEVAEILGWPKGTVKSTLSRALTRLRESLTAPGTATDTATGTATSPSPAPDPDPASGPPPDSTPGAAGAGSAEAAASPAAGAERQGGHPMTGPGGPQ